MGNHREQIVYVGSRKRIDSLFELSSCQYVNNFSFVLPCRCTLRSTKSWGMSRTWFITISTSSVELNAKIPTWSPGLYFISWFLGISSLTRMVSRLKSKRKANFQNNGSAIKTNEESVLQKNKRRGSNIVRFWDLDQPQAIRPDLFLNEGNYTIVEDAKNAHSKIPPLKNYETL